jgi:fibronectin-binding autotransporter adhesin
MADPYLIQLQPGDDEVTRDLAIQRWLTNICNLLPGTGGGGVSSLTAGLGIGLSGSTGAVTVSNLGVTSIVAGTNITISGATGAVTINASGGGGGGTSNVLAVTQTANGFTLGQCVFNLNGVWTLSDNTSLSTAHVDGVVTTTGTNTFSATLGGYQNTITGLAANTQYYLGTSGALTSTAPSSATAFVTYVLKTGVAGDGVVEISSPASLALLTVSAGGTGAATLTGLLLGNGTSPFTGVASANNGVLISGGTGTPSFLAAGSNAQVLTMVAGAPAWAASAAGFSNPMTTTGDIIYSSSGSTPARLGIGSTNQVLTVTGGVPVWGSGATGASLSANQTFTGIQTFAPTLRTSLALPYFLIDIPADTGITAATEGPGFTSVTATRTWATTGTVALQRENFWAGPTYASASASQTFTDAFTAYFTPPIAGTNAIFTRGHTLGIVDATPAASAITGGLVVATTLGTAATSVGIGGGNVFAGNTITCNGATGFVATASGTAFGNVSTINGALTGLSSTNQNVGTSAVSRLVLANVSTNLTVGYTGSGYTGAVISGVTAGIYAFLTTSTTSPIYLAPNSAFVLGADPTLGLRVFQTYTAIGTTGAVTINKSAGVVNFAIGATSLVVTNSCVTATSIIILTPQSNDTTGVLNGAVAAANSFTINARTGPAAAWPIGFLVINP